MATDDMGRLGGNYRINNSIFPAPLTSWREQPIAAGLNGIPINASYKLHTWRWDRLDGFWAKEIFSLFDTQQSSNSQLTTLETDPFDASGSTEHYGTIEYTDFVITSLSNRTRGLPLYDDLNITFEVYVAP